MPTDDELYHISDLLPNDLNLWGDLDEGRTHFTGRDYTWWRDVLNHPKAHRGCCKTCGCATTCMLSAFHEAVVMSVIQELARVGVIRGLPTTDCPRVDAEDKHGDHSWIHPEDGPMLCDGYGQGAGQ